MKKYKVEFWRSVGQLAIVEVEAKDDKEFWRTILTEMAIEIPEDAWELDAVRESAEAGRINGEMYYDWCKGKKL